MQTYRLFSVFMIVVILITSKAKRLPIEDDNDMEVSDLTARSFLNSENAKDLECVLCKFNMVPCCKPNLCIKKRFRPDECLELKPRDG